MLELSLKKEILYSLGAADSDIEALTEYTQNAFSFNNTDRADGADDEFLIQWNPVIQTAEETGAAAAVNQHLAGPERQIHFKSQETVNIELFQSAAGTIPVITADNTADFENMVRNIIYKGKDVPNISEMGASFAFGKRNRFIILSCKPYSNVSAERMGLSAAEWAQKSMLIRKHHECSHYYTKRFFGSSKNNLHDELIADFNGLYMAFGAYKAEWFLKFLGLAEDSGGIRGRIKIYTNGLAGTAPDVIEKIAVFAANGIENWTKTDEFLKMGETERINFLCSKELLEYI